MKSSIQRNTLPNTNVRITFSETESAGREVVVIKDEEGSYNIHFFTNGLKLACTVV